MSKPYASKSKSHLLAKIVSIAVAILIVFAVLGALASLVFHAVAFLLHWAIIAAIAAGVVVVGGMRVKSISKHRRERKLEHKYDV